LNKDFIFTPGLWLGEGKISFASSPDFLKFYTKWEIEQGGEKPATLKATQFVEIQGVEELVINNFIFSSILPTSFEVYLSNNLMGNISGRGLRDEKTVAWEFSKQLSCEGFEVYEKQENGDYFFHAEYGSPSQFRTTIEGLIWPKIS
jgi:hypothetical protein